jgi:hypothetical protein
MKKSWADIDEEERVQEESRYVPPHKKAPSLVNVVKPELVNSVSKEPKLPDRRNR